MIRFDQKKIQVELPLGEQLKQTRESHDITLEKLAQETKIKYEYLDSLNKGEYLKLPGEVFVRNFVLAYVKYFNLNKSNVLALYEEENAAFEKANKERVVKRSFVEAAHHKRSLNFSRVFKYFAILVVVGALLAYLGWEVNNILKPPSLVLENPSEDMVTEDRSIEIICYTLPEAIVTLNDQEITIDQEGRFSESISLQPGLNEIEIVSQKKHSRSNTIIREILVKE